jgi:hypothetical protein
MITFAGGSGRPLFSSVRHPAGPELRRTRGLFAFIDVTCADGAAGARRCRRRRRNCPDTDTSSPE